jgi:hypothetical protein
MGTKVTGAGLNTLSECKQLRLLTLAGLTPNDPGVTDLQKALPDLQVIHPKISRHPPRR